jgi:protein-disulfide isomerase
MHAAMTKTLPLLGLLGLFACNNNAGPASAPAASAPKATATAPSDGLRLPSDQVVATWDGGQYTYGDLMETVAPELRRARTDYLSKINQIEQRSLENAVMQKLLEEEAKKKDLTVEAYVKTLEPESAEVSDEEIQAFYDQRVRGQQPMEAVRPRIIAFLQSQAKQKAVLAAIDELKKSRSVKFDLPAPPIPTAEFDLTGRPSKGPDDAKVTVVEFSDFECPYCARAVGPVEEILKSYPDDVKVVFLHFPLSFHKQAMPAAIAAECAHQQGAFWKMHDTMFANQGSLADAQYGKWAEELGLDGAKFEACSEDPTTKKKVEADMKMGEAAGVGGTPSFYINGVQYTKGVPDTDAIKSVLGS